MKDFLIGVGIGFAVGAVLCKTCKPVAKAVEKGKKLVEEKLEEGKENFEKVKSDINETSENINSIAKKKKA